MSERRFFSRILAISLLLTLLPACNLPSTINVNCSVTDLINAINVANIDVDHTTINLDPGCDYVLTAIDNSDLYGDNGLPIVSTPITINGNNAAISRGGAAPDFRIFFVGDSGDLVLNDLSLVNGFANGSGSAFPGSGGAIYNQGMLQVNGSNLELNKADFHGGAIFAIGSANTNINSTKIDDNSAPRGGGIFVYGGGSLSVTGSQVIYNSASNSGGGINLEHGAFLSINDSIIAANKAGRHGGGIYKDGGADRLPTTLNNVTFFDNEAAWGGGAVFILRTPLSIYNSHFNNNHAQEYGGGLGYQNESSETVHIHNTSFDGNTAGLDGGGIHFSGELMTIDGSTLQHNQAKHGAGIHNAAADPSHYIVRPDTTMNITGSMIQENVTEIDPSSYDFGYGGGIYNGGEITISNSTIQHNEARAGGGIDNEGGTLIIHHSAIDHNVGSYGSGGGILSKSGTTLIDDNSQLENNFAQGGGAIWDTAGTLTIESSYISSNSTSPAGSDAGGGIAIYNSTVSLNNVILEDNSGMRGSAIHLMKGHLTLIDCQVLSNHATGHATHSDGAIRNSEGVAIIEHSNIEGNDSEANGGGIANENEMTIIDSTIIANDAGKDGGGVFNSGNLTIEETTFAENEAFTLGGGIHNTGQVTVQNSTFDSNSTGFDGGGLNTYSDATVIGSTFVDNRATRGGGLASVGGDTTLLNSTFSANTASDAGGGLFNMGPGIGETEYGGAMKVNHVTVAYNTAVTGGGIATSGGLLQIKNSIVAYSPSGADCYTGGADFAAVADNIDSDGSCAGFSLSDDPLLGPLGNNGGSTHTHALTSGSPAIDAAPDCTTIGGAPVPIDQRGAPRPGGAFCDLGAYEAEEGIAGPPDIPVVTTPAEPDDGPPSVTGRKNATCRLGPGTNYEEQDYLLEGQTALVTGRTHDSYWVEIEGPNWGKLCWVWVELLDVEGDINRAPVKTPPPTPTNTPTPTPVPEEPEEEQPPDQGQPPQQGCWWQPASANQPVCKVPCPNDQYSGKECNP